jgi:hypothetical protein
MIMISGEYCASIVHVCVASVGKHLWLDLIVTIHWQGCLPVAIRTCLSEFLCTTFRPVPVLSNRTYLLSPEGETTS